MKKVITNLFALFFLGNLSFAQNLQTVTFENLPLSKADTFWNGSDQSGYFETENLKFTNSYNTDWEVWSGFAYSNTTDTITGDYTNQYSVISGEGYNQSEKYLVYFSDGKIINKGSNKINSFYVNNTTYAYRDMQTGSSYSKKFGGNSGNDKDWFKLTVYNHNKGNITDSVEIYLADFRFDDNSQDYILKEWTKVDVSKFQHSDSLSFQLISSDNDEYGMRTPDYFALDNIEIEVNANSVENIESQLSIYPNPTSNLLNAKNLNDSAFEILDLLGNQVSQGIVQNEIISMTNLSGGIYILKIKNQFIKVVKE